MRSPLVGDVIRFVDDELEEGLVLGVLDPADHYHEGLGRYPDFVFRVLLPSGRVSVWDFYDSLLGGPEWEIVLGVEGCLG